MWERAEKTLYEGVGAQDAPKLLAIAKEQMKPRLTDLVTMTKDTEHKRVTCEATARASLPQELMKYDLAKVSQITGGSATITGGELVAESIEYSVQQSYDGQKEVLKLRKYEGFADMMAGMALVKFLGDREAAKATPPVPPTAAPAAAAASAAPAEAPAEGASAPDLQAEASAEFEAADKALNAAYQAARASMTDAQKNALRDEQRAWIKRRDAECSEAKITADTKGEVAGGSAMALEVAGCKTKLTQERTKQLAAKG